MIKWLLQTAKDYPFVWFAVIWIGIGAIALILNKLTNLVLNQLSRERNIQFSFIKSIIGGIAIPLIGIWIWISFNNPFNEYKLITHSSTAQGFIDKIEQDEDVIESNDDRNASIVYFYNYEFTFKSSSGKTIRGHGKENGNIPKHLSDVNQKPFTVIVEYLKDNPEVNRVKGMKNGNYTLYEWFRYSLLIGILVLLFASYLCFLIIKKGVKDYRNDLQKSKQNNLNEY